MSNFCSNCGNGIDQDDKFCPSCGHTINKHEEKETKTLLAQNENSQPVNKTVQKNKNKITKKHKRYLLNQSKSWVYFKYIYWGAVILICLLTVGNMIVNDTDNETMPGKIAAAFFVALFLQLIFVPIYLAIRLYVLTKLKNKFIESHQIKPEDGKSSKKSSYSIGSIFAFILIMALIRGVNYIIYTDKGNGSTTEQVKTLLSSNDFKEYVSPNHSFKVNFPGFPVIENQTLDIQSYKVPYTMYDKEIDNGKKVYAVYVYDYAPVPIESSQLSAEGGLNGMVQAMKGTIKSSSSTNLSGYPGVKGAMTIPIEGVNYDGYASVVVKEKKVYALLTIGVNNTDYEAFVKSFSFQ